MGADWGVKGHADLHWRMPSPKQMERLATAHAVGGNAPAARPVRPENDLPDEYWAALLNDAAADRGPPGPSIRALRLSEIPQHVLRMSCRRCGRTVEIQKADAVRLAGAQAVWKDVGQRLLDDTCQQRTGRHEEDGCWPSFE